MTSKTFWAATAERAVKTFAQALAALILVGMPIFDQAWGESLGIAATAAVLSVLTSVGSHGVTKDGPSLTHSETVKPAAE